MLRNSFYNSPAKAGVIVFGIALMLGSFVGFLLGFVIINKARCSPGDVCDGPAMAAVAISTFFFLASLVVGIILGIGVALILRRKARSILKVVP